MRPRHNTIPIACLLATVAWAACLIAAETDKPDHAYLVPCKGDSRAQEVFLEHVGKRVKLVCPIKYHFDTGFKVLKIRDDGIAATQRWPHWEENPSDPMDWNEGTFDIKTCHAKVMPEGIGIEVDFTIPDRNTAIVIEYRSENPYKTDGQGNRKLQLMIRVKGNDGASWEEVLQAIGLPLAPGLK